MKQPRTSDDEVIQIAMHPALIDPFVEWLASRNLSLGLIPERGAAIPTYVVTIPDWRWFGNEHRSEETP